jgi:hypothetical protein
VTTLDTFSTIGRLLILVGICENSRRSPNFVQIFSTVKIMYRVSQKWVGLHFGRFFHPESDLASAWVHKSISSLKHPG